MSALTVTELRTVAQLAALAPEWWALWRRCGATPFQSPAWLLPWWDAFAPGALRVLTIRRGAELVGLAPLYREDGSRGRRLLSLGIGASDYLDVLLDPEREQETAQALAQHIEDSLRDYDECELGELPPGAAALRLRLPAGVIEHVDAHSVCPVLTLPPRIEALRQVIPAAKRQKLRTARNRAARRGEVEILRGNAQNREQLFSALVRLHGARWQTRGEAGVLTDPRVVSFHRGAIAALDAAGLLRLWALRIGGEIVGAYYGFADAERAYAYLTGFDPAYEFESPGTILAGHAIEEAVRDGASEFHLLRGREAYKYSWGAADRANRRRVWRKAEVYARVS
ncbi:MAG TPA: GNAT family N-acetyltransferase [Xanthobacteraceae bacterium]